MRSGVAGLRCTCPAVQYSSRLVLLCRQPSLLPHRVVLPITAMASGIVVRPPRRARDNPAALRWSLLNRLASNRPMPTPRATRVPAMSISSAMVSVRFITVSSLSLFQLAFSLQSIDGTCFRFRAGFNRRMAKLRGGGWHASVRPSVLRVSDRLCPSFAPPSFLLDAGPSLRAPAPRCAFVVQDSPATRLSVLPA